MTNPISLSLNDVARIQTTNTEFSPTPPLLTKQEFGDRVFSFLETSYRNGYDPDYVAGELQKFAEANPETAKEAKFPLDRFGIRSLVVERYYDFQKMRETYGSEPAKAAECMAEKAPDMIKDGIECVNKARSRSDLAMCFLEPVLTVFSCQIDALKDEKTQTDISKD